ncbi:9725_t:CDS:2 [Ambispora leptoticha]|uniref:9725_t:CDS:1 n=1 Tax=Ambispora leptoticha TaxID=144679 RepID=A0A9N9C1V4_9GLOM|nr:9725_t:CDS:2 [Ambispora leptoticha]
MGNSKSTSKKQKIALTNERQKQQIRRKEEYYLPKSYYDIDRLQRHHFFVKHVFGHNFSCPLEETLKTGARVLDGGCGPGVWLLDMATQYPNSHFYGIDIEPLYPSQIKPANVNFYRCDLMQLEKLNFEENSFDMVRIGFMNLTFNEEIYAKIIEKMLKFLKPGGYFEISEVELIYSNIGKNFTQMMKTLITSLERSADLTLKHENMLLATGQLTNIQQVIRVTKLGSSGGFAGELYLSLVEEFFMGPIRMLLGEVMDMSPKEYEQFWQQCKAECIELGTGVPIKRIWGQKIVI